MYVKKVFITHYSNIFMLLNKDEAKEKIKALIEQFVQASKNKYYGKNEIIKESLK